MITKFVTFTTGRREQWEHADPDGWLEVTAPSDESAYRLLSAVLGETRPGVIDCAFIYSQFTDDDRDHFPRGCIARLSVNLELVEA